MKVEDIKVGMKVRIARILVKEVLKADVDLNLHVDEVGTVEIIEEDEEWGYYIMVVFEDADALAYQAGELEKA